MRVLCDRLVPDVRLAARCMAVRVESDIGCVRQMARQTGFPTTDIKDLLPRSNDLGDPPEFGPRETRSIQWAPSTWPAFPCLREQIGMSSRVG